jgi:3-oxoacyl-[acyl-carrier-protein] synthase II
VGAFFHDPRRLTNISPVLFPSAKPASPPPRVVVTGAGIVTALGLGWQANAAGFRAGQTAFREIRLFDVSRQRVRRAAEVDLPTNLPPHQLPTKETRRLDRAVNLLLLAALEAWQQAGWEEQIHLPVVLGTTSAGMAEGEAYWQQTIQHPSRLRGQPTRAMQYLATSHARWVTAALGARGPVTLISNACASGSNAIGFGWELLRQGNEPRVLVGGYDALSLMTFAGFDSLQALSPDLCRPFDVNRNGLALGEGAAVLTLETLEFAQRRGAAILAEVAGYGATVDLHHLTQPHPQGDAALETMQQACATAGLSPENIDYVNAHGTGTPLNDASEAMAISRWAGTRVKTLPVSSTKASIGHLLGAAGAVEAVVCLMVLREQWLPPQTTLNNVDPLCQFPVVTQPTDACVKAALSNSFGFGGANATLLFRRWP